MTPPAGAVEEPPARRYRLELEVDADELIDLVDLLDELGRDLARGMAAGARVGGGASRGYVIRYEDRGA